MECPNCGFRTTQQSDECLKCGVIFSKFREKTAGDNRKKSPGEPSKPQDTTVDDGDGHFISRLLFYVQPRIDPMSFGFRVFFFLVFLIWGLKFIFTPYQTNYTGESIWHLINLPFHEAGHIFFRPFGRFMTSFGGSLSQILMPLVCLCVFLVKTRDTFAAAFCLWWMGESFMDLAPYIDDARTLTLPLLGGNTGQTSPYGFHDWEFILTETGLLRFDHALASFSYTLGSLLMIMAFAWWGYVLYKQYRNLDLP